MQRSGHTAWYRLCGVLLAVCTALLVIAAAIAAKTGLSASQVTIKEINSVAFDTPKYADPSRLYTNMTVKATYNGSKSVTVSIPVFDTVKNALSLKLNNAQNEMFSVVKEQKGFRVYARRWGHGVGMSQRGAAQMANTGYNYAQILGFYYTGITRVRMEFVRSLAGSISGRPVEAVPTPAPVEDAQALATQLGCGRLSALVPSAQGGTALAQAIGDPLPIPLHLGFDFD